MGLRIRFNLRFVLLAIVPYFIVLGFVPGIVEQNVDALSVLRGTAGFKSVGWKQYLAGLATVGYAVSLCYWMVALFAYIYASWLRNWLAKRSDADRTK